MENVEQIALNMGSGGAEKRVKIDRKKVASALNKNGFFKTVASRDFDKAVEAFSRAMELKRGVFVMGEPGCGKTQLMRAIYNIKNPGISRWVDVFDPVRIDHIYRNPEVFYSGDVFLDDFGCEEFLNDFGVVVDAVGGFIAKYHRFGRGGLYVTTNLKNGEELKERYGGRILDRICEMCVILKMTGASKRKAVVVG